MPLFRIYPIMQPPCCVCLHDTGVLICCFSGWWWCYLGKENLTRYLILCQLLLNPRLPPPTSYCCSLIKREHRNTKKGLQACEGQCSTNLTQICIWTQVTCPVLTFNPLRYGFPVSLVSLYSYRTVKGPLWACQDSWSRARNMGTKRENC